MLKEVRSERKVGQDPTSVERCNLRGILDRRKAEIAIKGENEARRRLSDAEAHFQSRDWERRKSGFPLYEGQQQLESQKMELLAASQWVDQTPGERIHWCGELELKNRIYHENQVRTS